MGGGRKALGKVWTGREDWALFQHLHPTASKPDCCCYGYRARLEGEFHTYAQESKEGDGLADDM